MMAMYPAQQLLSGQLGLGQYNAHNALASQQSQLAQVLLFAQAQSQYAPPRTEGPPVERGEMQVCNLIGWRAWRITQTGYLQSASVEAIWLPGEPMRGVVEDYNGEGIHAYKARADALCHPGAAARVAFGSVLLWGDVVEHERGYRATCAKIVSIDDVIWDGNLPWSCIATKALSFLRDRYGLAKAETRTVA